MRGIFKKIINSFLKAMIDFIRHDGIEHAGYMTLIVIIALFPFLVLIIAIAGFIGELDASKEFINMLINEAPVHVQNFLLPRILEITSGPPESIRTIAILGAIWTASSSFEGLRTIFNRAYRVISPPAYIFRRLLSIMQFLIFTMIIFLLIFMLIFVPIIALKIARMLEIEINIFPYIYMFRTITIPCIMLTFVSSLYYFLPNIKQSLRKVLPGAILVVISWSISGSLLSLYLKNFRQVNLIYGSLEGIIITLLFFYINNITLIFGAEFNYHLSNINHKHVK